MSVLRLYEDPDLIQLVSRDGEFSNPDDESSLDGTNGQTALKELWLAVEQTTLAADIPDTEAVTVSLAAARFADTGYSVIKVGDEKMLVTAGHGTTSLTVIRGHNGTPPAAHAAGEPVRLACDSSAISIDCQDLQGTDESGWVTYCDDVNGNPNGAWEAPHALPNVNYDSSVKFWRRVVVPAGTPAAYKQDLVHRVSCTVNETA